MMRCGSFSKAPLPFFRLMRIICVTCTAVALFLGSRYSMGRPAAFWVHHPSRCVDLDHRRSQVFLHTFSSAYVPSHKSRLFEMRPSSDNGVITETQNTTAFLMIDTNVSSKLFLPNQILRFRGIVDMGYGRGGKKLGVPTANLGPSTLFDFALSNVSTGVYLGHAVLEGDSDTLPHKAVVNIGYSPTFVGQENAVKIIEAHLIVDAPIPDFYQETMRLQLIGFMRNEMKFPSFSDLIAQIQYDVRTASHLLDRNECSVFVNDPFLISAQPWIGTSGGNASVSWEFPEMLGAPREISA